MSTVRYLTAFVIVGAFALTGAACAAPTSDDGAASNDSALTETDQAGIDAQVLQIWTPGRLYPQAPQPWQSAGPKDVSIDAKSACTVLETNSWSHWEDRKVDCAPAFAAAAPFDVTHAAGPVMTPVRFTVSKDVTGSAVYVDPDFCNMVEVRVVVREAAAAQPSFAGVGFWTSRGDSLTAKNDLQEVGRAQLVNGEAAIVYRFSGISTCISSAHNSTSGNSFQTFAFKPYAAFDTNAGGETRRYRVWEKIQGNHTIGRSWPGSQPVVDSTGFDRQRDLLAH
ncbi:MAG: hypothetical protein JWP87_925 [Labilithrix sp.]|nr:hypothetical protein [Labilithrix sp.]